MQGKYLSLSFGLLLLAPVVVTANDLEAQKRGQAHSTPSVSASDAPRASLEAQKVGRGPVDGSSSPLDAPQTRLEELKKGSVSQARAASFADAPSVGQEELKRFGQRALTEGAIRGPVKQSPGAAQAAIDAIPLKRGFGPRILPFPDAAGRPILIDG